MPQTSPARTRTRDIFLSHASEDVDVARRVCENIERAGWSVFLAVRDLPGDLKEAEWSQRIDEALDGCGLLVLLSSPEALTKKWVTYEWRSVHDDILADRGGWLVPLCVRGVGPDQLGRALRRYQAVDLRRPEDWEGGFTTLLAIVEGYLKRPIKRQASLAPKRVLTIRGAGVRTLVATAILQELETAARETGGTCLADCFDLIVGNEFASLSAVLLAEGASVAECTAETLDTLANALRPNNLLFRLSAKYSTPRLKGVLAERLGDRSLTAAAKYAISTFDLTTAKHCLWSARSMPDGFVATPPLAELVAASIASPTYFEPVDITDAHGTTRRLIDGGVWESDPARIGLEALRKMYVPTPLIADIILLAVGPGYSPPRPFPETEKPNLIYWASHLPSLMMTASREFVRDHVDRLFRDGDVANQSFRFDPILSVDDDRPFDDLTQGSHFTSVGSTWAADHRDQFHEAAELLLNKS